jgi:hypothetical protein
MTNFIDFKKGLLLSILLIGVLYLLKNFIFTYELPGKYILKNGSDRFNTNLDTLYISTDLTFRNKEWGSGTVKLKYRLKGTKIKFFYKYEMGEGVISKSIYRNILGVITINLNKDLEYEYVKVN